MGKEVRCQTTESRANKALFSPVTKSEVQVTKCTTCFPPICETHLRGCSAGCNMGCLGRESIATLVMKKWKKVKERVLWHVFCLPALASSFCHQETLPTSHICSKALPPCKTSWGMRPPAQLAASAHQPVLAYENKMPGGGCMRNTNSL